MGRKLRFTKEAIDGAIKEADGSAHAAAKALGCSYPTVYNHINQRSRNGRNGHAQHVEAPPTVADAIASAVKQHESRLREIETLIVERTFLEEQIGLLKMAQGILNPKPPAPVALPALPSPNGSGTPEAK